ncbi:eukaryotic translation initiation factor 4E [Cystobasidiomycetes sp. EMM_F5]
MSDNASSSKPLATVPEDQATASTSSSLPPAAKAAAEAAVKTAISETLDAEEGEIDESKGSEVNGDAGGLRTVFSDPKNFNVVHPLYSKWILWFDNASKADKAKEWEEQLQQVMAFESVEEFWGLYNNIVPPSHIATNSNYYLFKAGIKPAWEDPANAEGGKWAIQLPRDKSRDVIDNYWLYTMLAAIGETFETPHGVAPSPDMPFTDEVTGIIISSRRGFYRISIWTRTSDSKAKVEDIGKHFKFDILNNAGKQGGFSSEVEFQSHRASQVRGKKPAFVL